MISWALKYAKMTARLIAVIQKETSDTEMFDVFILCRVCKKSFTVYFLQNIIKLSEKNILRWL